MYLVVIKVDLKDVDEILYLYMKDHNKKFNQYCKYLITGMISNTTNVSWSNLTVIGITLFKRICL